MNTEASNEAVSQTPAENNEPSWRDSLPEEFRDNPSLKDFKDVGGLAKSYIHAESLIGKDKIVLPSPDADDEAWNEVYTKLGRPEKAEDYGITQKPENWDDEIPFDENFASTIQSFMHEAGLNSKQAQKLSAKYNEFYAAQIKQQNEQWKEQYQQTEKALQSEWGDKYDTNLQEANKALKHYAGDEGTKALVESGALNNPSVARMFYNLSKNLKEDSSIGLNNSQGFGNGSPSLARQEKAGLLRDPQFKEQYYKANVPGHKEAVKKIQELDQIIYGNFDM